MPFESRLKLNIESNGEQRLADPEPKSADELAAMSEAFSNALREVGSEEAKE